jgi:hypothetical protein
MAVHDDGLANGDREVGELESQTRNGNEISYVAEAGCRTTPDGSQSRVHLGYSSEGFHTIVETMRFGNWGEAHASIQAATEAAWKEVFENNTKEQNNVAELPEHVKAQVDQAVANVNKAEVKMADAGPSVNGLADAYDPQAMEAQRQQQRQNSLDRKAPDAGLEPGKE